MIALRNAHSAVPPANVFSRAGRALRDGDVKDIVWLNPDGQRDDRRRVDQCFARCLRRAPVGPRPGRARRRGKPVEDDDLLLLLNAHHDAIPFTLPGDGGDLETWPIDTSYAAKGVSGRGAVAAGRTE